MICSRSFVLGLVAVVLWINGVFASPSSIISGYNLCFPPLGAKYMSSNAEVKASTGEVTVQLKKDGNVVTDYTAGETYTISSSTSSSYKMHVSANKGSISGGSTEGGCSVKTSGSSKTHTYSWTAPGSGTGDVDIVLTGGTYSTIRQQTLTVSEATAGVAATAPSSVSAVSPTKTSLDLAWTAGTANDCVFDSWKVLTSDGGAVAGCTGLTSRSTLACTATGLAAGTEYQFTVTEVCSAAGLNSDKSTASAAVSTLAAAVAASSVSAASPTKDSLDITWTAGSANDCVFDSWNVMLAGGEAVAGCTGLTSRSILTCTATGLTAGTEYQFTVEEVCSDASLNSGKSATSASVSTSASVAATAPTSVSAVSPTKTSLDLAWTAGTANDCVFDSWKVLTSDGGAVAGCTGLTSRSTLACTATGLTANTGYRFTVEEVCSDASLNSAKSTASTSVSTSASVAATAPASVSAGSPTKDSLDLTWTAGTANDCVFDSWSVMLAGGGAVAGCTGLTSRSTLACTATGLTAGTEYQFTVTEVCSAAGLNSDKSTASAAVSTFTAAGAPTNLTVDSDGQQYTGSDASAEFRIELEWKAGVANDCVFDSWRVRLTTKEEEPVTGCTGLNTRAVTSCNATVDSDDELHLLTYTVEETCTLPALNSGKSVAVTSTFDAVSNAISFVSSRMAAINLYTSLIVAAGTVVALLKL